MYKEVSFRLAAAILFFAAYTTAALSETQASPTAPDFLALVSRARNDAGQVNLKQFADNGAKAVFITLADPLSGFAINSIDARALGSGMGRNREFRFDVANLIGKSEASALYLGTVNPGNSLIRITLGANPSTAPAAPKSGGAANEVPSDPTILLLFGLGFAALSGARRAGWI
ncbi:MAG: hypothetical protein ACR2FI_02240 [Burkholderiales bacterium]|nr:hypothetical protein [Pseudomonadota bacterium]